MFVSEEQRRKKVIWGYLLSAKYYMKGWEYNSAQDNVTWKHVLINKCLWMSFFFKKNPITVGRLDKNQI